jgi:hypothetical protein
MFQAYYTLCVVGRAELIFLLRFLPNRYENPCVVVCCKGSLNHGLLLWFKHG